MALVTTTCHCGRGEQGDLQVSVKDGIAVVQCPCGQLRTAQRDEDYERLYIEGEVYHTQVQQQVGHAPYTARYRHDVDIADLRVDKLFQHFRSLDVGCANGAFVDTMANIGWQAEGLEVNPHMVAWIREQYARGEAEDLTPVLHTSWDTVHGEFDLITYHDVFEHVVNPKQELARIRRFLRDGAMLVLDVPDASEVFGPQARATHHERPEQHLWYFTERTLKQLLWDAGFSIVDVELPIVGKLVVYARKRA